LHLSLSFERSSKRRKGYPSETKVKRGARVVTAKKNSSKNSAATTCAPAAPAAAFKRRCLRTGKYDGTNRAYFFPRVAKRSR